MINKKTGKKLVLDLDSPNVEILTSEELKNSTLRKRKFREDAYIDEKVFSDNEEDYPSQEEIEREVEEALRNIEID